MATAIGLISGSPAFFWAGKPSHLSDREYWFSTVPSLTPSESQLALIASWPAKSLISRLLDSSLPLLRLACTSPHLGSERLFQGVTRGAFPEINPVLPTLPVVLAPAIEAWEALLSALFSLPASTSTRLKLARTADLLDLGLSWPLVIRLAKLTPNEAPEAWAGLAWRCHDPQSALAAVSHPASTAWSQAFADYLLTCSPDELVRLPGNPPLLTALRDSGRTAVESIITPRPRISEGTDLQKIPRQTRVMQHIAGSLICPVLMTSLDTEFIPSPHAPIAWCIATLSWQMTVRNPVPEKPVARLEWEVAP